MAATTTRDIVLRLEGTVNQIMLTVAKLDKSINGNGVPGLKNDVQELRGRVVKVEERHCAEDLAGDKKDTRSWDMRKGIVLLAVGQCLTIAGLVVAVRMGLR